MTTLLRVRTIIRKKPMVTIEFDYQIYNEQGELLAEANTILAFMDWPKNKPVRCPDYLIE